MTSFRIDTFPHQLPQPLERLNVYDGLIMNAERWEVSQSYFRQRQNLLFQAKSQSGIVCGLGIKVIRPPTWCRARTREQDAQRKEQRWLEIQPGVAIDAAGNPIVVGKGREQDRTFRISTPSPASGVMTVYIVAQYVEPYVSEADTQRDTVAEQCRFEERTDPPGNLDVELCRLQLTPGPVQLSMPQDVFAPASGELDLRYRQLVRPRSMATIRVGFVGQYSQKLYDNFEYLKRSMTVLMPNMQVDLVSEAVQVNESLPIDAFNALYISEAAFQPVLSRHSRWFEAFVNQGGTIILETATAANDLPQGQPLFRGLTPWADLRANHPLKTDPFLFTQPPEINHRSINITLADGLVWIDGELSSAWGVHRPLPRHDIRTAQELGANLLYYIWQRQHLTGLLSWSIDQP